MQNAKKLEITVGAMAQIDSEPEYIVFDPSSIDWTEAFEKALGKILLKF